MRRLWAVLIGLAWLATACSNGGNGSPTGPSSVTADAKPKRNVSLSCAIGTSATVTVNLLTGGVFGTVLATASGVPCGGSTLLTGVGAADAFRASYVITAPFPGGGCFTNALLPHSGATDTCTAGGGTATLTIK